MKDILKRPMRIAKFSFCLCLEAILLAILILFVFTACSHKNTLDTFNKYYYEEDTHKAYKYAKSQAGDSGDVLWNLQAGISAFEIQNEDAHNILEQGENLLANTNHKDCSEDFLTIPELCLLMKMSKHIEAISMRE